MKAVCDCEELRVGKVGKGGTMCMPKSEEWRRWKATSAETLGKKKKNSLSHLLSADFHDSVAAAPRFRSR